MTTPASYAAHREQMHAKIATQTPTQPLNVPAEAAPCLVRDDVGQNGKAALDA
jgi:hypothetical protein